MWFPTDLLYNSSLRHWNQNYRNNSFLETSFRKKYLHRDSFTVSFYPLCDSHFRICWDYSTSFKEFLILWHYWFAIVQDSFRSLCNYFFRWKKIFFFFLEVFRRLFEDSLKFSSSFFSFHQCKPLLELSYILWNYRSKVGSWSSTISHDPVFWFHKTFCFEI